MDSKIKQEKGSKHLFNIRFMQKIGKTNKLIIMKQQRQKKNRLTFNNKQFFSYIQILYK